MELMPHSLSKVIRNKSISFGDKEIYNWACQAARGLACLHTNDIIHRDVKPANFLVSNDLQVLKICDFGISRPEINKTMTSIGTLEYLAPEILSSHYTRLVDVFSLAISIWEMFKRKHPSPSHTVIQICNTIINKTRPEIDGEINVEVAKTLRKCLDNIPENRYEMRELAGIFYEQYEIELTKEISLKKNGNGKMDISLSFNGNSFLNGYSSTLPVKEEVPSIGPITYAICVSNLPTETTVDNLRSLFRLCGHIVSTEVYDYNEHNDKQQVPKVYGFINFKNNASRDKAKHLNKREYKSHIILVDNIEDRKYPVFLGSISVTTTLKMIEDELKRCDLLGTYVPITPLQFKGNYCTCFINFRKECDRQKLMRSNFKLSSCPNLRIQIKESKVEKEQQKVYSPCAQIQKTFTLLMTDVPRGEFTERRAEICEMFQLFGPLVKVNKSEVYVPNVQHNKMTTAKINFGTEEAVKMILDYFNGTEVDDWPETVSFIQLTSEKDENKIQNKSMYDWPMKVKTDTYDCNVTSLQMDEKFWEIGPCQSNSKTGYVNFKREEDQKKALEWDNKEHFGREIPMMLRIPHNPGLNN